jgi:hypothetical protein
VVYYMVKPHRASGRTTTKEKDMAIQLQGDVASRLIGGMSVG